MSEYKTLADLVRSQEIGQLKLAKKAGVSLRAVAEVKSGEWEREILSDTWSTRKKEFSLGAIARLIRACGESPTAWMEKLGINTALPGSTVQRIVQTANSIPHASRRQSVSNRWSSLDTIAKEPVSEHDLELLLKASDLGDIFTVEMAVQILLNNHK